MPQVKPTIQVYADKKGEWRFRFICDQGDALFHASEGYTAKANAYKGIDSVKRNISDDKRIEFKVNNRGKHFYTIKARNGNILAVGRNQEELDILEEDIALIRAQLNSSNILEIGTEA